MTIDAVSNEFLNLWTFKGFEWRGVNWWQLDHLTHLVLASWLLLHVLLLLWIHWSSCWNWLRHTWCHSFKLLLVAFHLIRIMLLIHVLILFGITSSLIVTATSAAVISLSPSSVLVLLSSVTVIPVLKCLTLVWILYSHLIIGHHVSVTLSKFKP